MREAEIRLLRSLQDSLLDGVQRSKIAKSCSGLVDELRTCGAVDFGPAKCGRGVALYVANEKALERFIKARLPGGADIDRSAITERAAAVVLRADAKAVRKSVGQGIFVRSTKTDCIFRSADGQVEVPVGRLSCDTGGAAIQLSTDRIWTFTGTVVVIENADAFWQHQTVLPNVDVAIFGCGNLSDRLVSWLGSTEMNGCDIAHWGDYDPVGVCEYLRLIEACGRRVEPFAPLDIEALLPIYGKRSLVTRQPRYLERLRHKICDPYVARMVHLFDTHRRGLEQEVLLQSLVTGEGLGHL
ncbi:MAG: Wadjet anti-phage system protein JetD domain-containing protein [Pirellulales bacterium]